MNCILGSYLVRVCGVTIPQCIIREANQTPHNNKAYCKTALENWKWVVGLGCRSVVVRRNPLNKLRNTGEPLRDLLFFCALFSLASRGIIVMRNGSGAVCQETIALLTGHAEWPYRRFTPN